MRNMSFTGVVCLLCAVVLFVFLFLATGYADPSTAGALIVVAIFDAAGFVIGVMLIALDKVRDAILRKLEADK